MNAEELMIGDIVRVSKDVCIKKGTIVEIRGIDADRVFPEKPLKGCAACVPVGDPDGVSGGVWLEYLEPVPLTPEILERNGFVTKDKGREHYGYLMYFLYDEEDHCLLGVKWYIKDSIAEITLETTPYYIIIKFVHQLLHTLRLCGLRKEIKLEG